jgi:hypothetical protein
MAPAAQAAPLVGTTELPPSLTVFPGATADDPGTLLATLVSPYSFLVPDSGTTSGELRTAVFRNNTGTLDFYYQVANDAGSATAIARESNANFAGFDTFVGFRLDGGSLPGGMFTNGTVEPFSADRGVQGIVVGFNFGPTPDFQVRPGMTSTVLVISTNAINFKAGNASIIDGGTQTVAAFAPAAIPEPSSALLVFGGIAAALVRMRKRSK